MRQWRWWESLGGNIQIPVGRVEVGGKEGGWQANRSPVVTPAAAAAIHTICPHYPHSANLTCIAPSACWALHAWKHTNIQTAGLMWHLRCPHCRPCIPFSSLFSYSSPYPIMHIAILHAKPLPVPVPCGRATNTLSACHLPVAPSVYYCLFSVFLSKPCILYL